MTTQTVLQEISMAAQVAAPIAGAASPEAGLILGLTPVFIQIMQQVINEQSAGTDTAAQMAAKWAQIVAQDESSSAAIQAFVAQKVAAHNAAATGAAPRVVQAL